MKITFEKMKDVKNAMFGLEKTKINYAFNKVFKTVYNNALTQYNDDVELIRIDNALIDEKTKELLYDDQHRYKFSKEGLKSFIVAAHDLNKAWDEKEFEIEPFIVNAQEVPELTQEQTDLFSGILI